MRSVQREALVPYSAEAMYDLVNDIERYPDFLPWCREARVLESADTELTASLTLIKGGLRRSFTTRNRMEPGRLIDIQLVDGPFRHLEGEWRFEPLRDDASKVKLDMRFEVAGLLDAVLGPVFHQIANSLVDAFVRRAQDRHG
ncbi:ribosome-associated toxin RatA of RatAB toxin-antitoxin module [Natronospira proteinivora]|uniref:Ribosome-associated toxin RatA of RatAB toxin-antitoxin module n=1 Tax=Natronospira proteinivora TaxID=1807133 RepID=A0ABT1G6S8_9GAMM|nr:type II toxin-antitoxin system RatA family toxin [Natronospira proteinivora]MCP1727005.1 ribosome-associated toxin RatA of RatAB toxin-antitoxin module [Natronospira proteinivora]